MKLFNILLLLLLEKEECWERLFWFIRVWFLIFLSGLSLLLWLSSLLRLLSWFSIYFLRSLRFSFFLLFLFWLTFLNRSGFLFWFLLNRFFLDVFWLIVRNWLINQQVGTNIIDFFECLSQDLRDFLKGFNLIHFNMRLNKLSWNKINYKIKNI